MNEDGELFFWINDFDRLHPDWYNKQEKKWSSEEALQTALKHGKSGWWTLTELELLIAGEGPILERAMRECGFRPHKRNPNQWARVSESQEKKRRREDQEKRERRRKEEEEKRWFVVSERELKRLNQLRVLPNEWDNLYKTHSIQVNNKGLIHIYFEINFSAIVEEGLNQFDKSFRSMGHIARQQNEFYIEAKNISLGQEKSVYVKAIRPDNSYIECIWPYQVSEPEIYDLADDLVSNA